MSEPEIDESLTSEGSGIFTDNNSGYDLVIKSERHMSSVFMNPSVLTKFIEMYKSFPCLWKTNHKSYTDRVGTDKKMAFNELLTYTKQFLPEATLTFLKKRVQIIRGCFRKQYAIVLKKAANNIEYKPKLWYYDLLLFLVQDQDQKAGDETEDSSVVKNEVREDETETETETVIKAEEDNSINQESCLENEMDLPCTTSTETFHAVQEQPQQQTTTAINQLGPLQIDFMTRNTQRREPPEFSDFSPSKRLKPTPPPSYSSVEFANMGDSECELLGKMVAAKMRSMDNIQRLHADKLINDVLYKGMLGNLTETCYIGEYYSHNNFNK